MNCWFQKSTSALKFKSEKPAKLLDVSSSEKFDRNTIDCCQGNELWVLLDGRLFLKNLLEPVALLEYMTDIVYVGYIYFQASFSVFLT